jgi:hypothetical protein
MVEQSERMLRAEAQEELRRSMDLDALLEPGPSELAQVRRIIRGRIDAFNHQAVALGNAPIADVSGLEQRIVDTMLGFGRGHRQRPA